MKNRIDKEMSERLLAPSRSKAQELINLGVVFCNDKKIDKAYLEGRYGGVPIFSTVFPIEKED